MNLATNILIYTYREGYHKLLVDFKMFDADGNILPQGNITPNLNEGFMKDLLNAEVKKKQDYKFPQKVYDDIDHKFGEKASQSLDNEPSGVVQYAEAFEIRKDDEQKASENIAEETLTPEIRAEIAADITEVLSKPEELQSVSQSKYLQWKERNPGFAAFFIQILYPFLLMIIPLLTSIWLARPVKNAQVYEEPTSTSNVVYNVTVENNITVVGDAPYFYKVEFPDPETGELVTGYIYKANLAEVVPDATESAEVTETIPETTESQTEPTE